jgi:hypothetical protein
MNSPALVFVPLWKNHSIYQLTAAYRKIMQLQLKFIRQSFNPNRSVGEPTLVIGWVGGPGLISEAVRVAYSQTGADKTLGIHRNNAKTNRCL